MPEEEEEETDTIDMLEDLSGGGEISEVAVRKETHTTEEWEELAQRNDLLSSQIWVACEEEKELEKRVRGIGLKINHKRDDVIMLRNVVKMTKDKVEELRKTVTHIEPVRSTSSTNIEGAAVMETNGDELDQEDNMASTKTNMSKR